MAAPADWKSYDDFSAGIDTNRLPPTDALAGRSLRLSFPERTLRLDFAARETVRWSLGGDHGTDWYEAIEVAPSTFFIDMTFRERPREALSIVLNTANRRVLGIRQKIREQRVEGQPLVEQGFDVGVLGDPAIAPGGFEPAPTRDLIGLRAFYRYSPRHLYEHVYLSSERYCWQCLVGEQRGHGDVDLATTYKFDDEQYVFTFREFIIPVASVFFYNMKDLRSTGKFLGVTAAGSIENNKAGAFIQKASMTYYGKDWEPV